ncbi:rhamnulokinase family protein [Lentzea sp. NPDC058450]|uniref:rhamnulokinase n=1 Tax=Lentzea sp. NPDC058450 TaxID=3346505 RepID=UPI003668EBD2
MTVTVAAVDLGASSGRVLRSEVGPGHLELDEVTRFPNGPVRLGDTLHWDAPALHQAVLTGLKAAGPRLDGVGIDSWAVDYGLLDATGALLGNPVHYRDNRTDGVAAQLKQRLPDLYSTNGLQELPFTTIYQLASAAGTPQLEAARSVLLVPDLLGYWLTGRKVAETTNASTTGLLNARTRAWAEDLITAIGLDPALFPSLVRPGEIIGDLFPHVQEQAGLAGATPLIAVGSHDTASAVLGVPATGPRFAYVATGTWSLVGVELTAPVLTAESRAANFTNELGVDGTVRYLRNVMGLWLLQECLREWGDPDLGELLAAAAGESPLAAVVDAGDPEFIPPGGMTQRIVAAAARHGDPPASRPAVVRCVLDSLALAHRRSVREAAVLSGTEVEVVHVVGGGARNALLCQLTADACGLPVVAGPVEAAAVGNALVQARALGALRGDMAALRDLVARTQPLRRYEPSDDESSWDKAERRLQP